MHAVTRFALALVLGTLPAIAPLGAMAGTTTSMDGGVQMIVTTPDLPPAPQPKPKKKPAAKVAVATVPEIAAGPSSTNVRYENAIVQNAEALLGRPYRFGGVTPGGFDCSGFTQYLFAQLGIRIPRTADAQFAAGRRIAGNPEPGDLVFFQTYDYGASHVALYLGGGRFINAIGANVHEADFDSPYFRGRYLGARRFLPD